MRPLRLSGVNDDTVTVETAGKDGERIGFAGSKRACHLHVIGNGRGKRLIAGIIDRNGTCNFLSGRLETDLGSSFETDREPDLREKAVEIQMRSGSLGDPHGGAGTGLYEGNLERNALPVDGSALSGRNGNERSPSFRHLAGKLGHLAVGSTVRQRLDRSAVRKENGLTLDPAGLGAVGKVLDGGREDDIAGQRDIGVHIARSVPGAADIGNLNSITARRKQRYGGNQKDQCFFHIVSF